MRSNPARMPTMRSRCRVTKRSMGRLRMLRWPNTSSSERPWSVRRFYERADHRLLWLRPSPRWVSVSLWPFVSVSPFNSVSSLIPPSEIHLRAEGEQTSLQNRRRMIQRRAVRLVHGQDRAGVENVEHVQLSLEVHVVDAELLPQPHIDLVPPAQILRARFDERHRDARNGQRRPDRAIDDVVNVERRAIHSTIRR